MNSEEIESNRIKLLTLLNVVAIRPTHPHSEEEQQQHQLTPENQPSKNQKRERERERDWIQIAKSFKQQQQQQQITSEPSLEPEPVPNSSGEDPRSSKDTSDLYHHHFGPNTELLSTQSIQDHPSWKIDSNSKSSDRRIIRFQIDPSSSSSSSDRVKKTTQIPPSLRPFVQKFNRLESNFFDSLKHYEDVWHTDLPYDHNRHRLRPATSIWALQHIIKTRNQIIKNNQYLATQNPSSNKRPKLDVSSQEHPQLTSVPSSKSAQPQPQPQVERETRDQGFTRPKVLILVPFRSSALEWVQTITTQLSGTTDDGDDDQGQDQNQKQQKKKQIKGFDRFLSDFKLPEGTIDRLQSEDAAFKYPLDHRIIFRGNVDDDFKLAIKLNRKEVRLYADFYQADLIVASPVGLRKSIEKHGDADFLSSIEIAIVDQMDVMQMQNWDHVEFVFEHLNQIPKKPRDTDFSRVKPWYLDSHANKLRQTILYSSFVSAEQASLFRSLTNLAGKSLEFHHHHATQRVGVLPRIRKGLRQTWYPIDLHSPQDGDLTREIESRLDFFRDHFLIPLQRSALVKAGLAPILLFIPSYFDFVRLLDLFRAQSSEEDLKFAAISEYSSHSEISSARTRFFNRQVSWLLVTERFHFYHRYKLRGAKRMIFYGPPVNPEYYLEFVNEYPFLSSSSASSIDPSKRRPALPAIDQEDVTSVEEFSVHTIFSSLDRPRLEKILGLVRTHEIFHPSPSPITTAGVQQPPSSFTFV